MVNITDEQIVNKAKRNGGEIWVNWQWRNDRFRRRMAKLVKKGLFKRARYMPGADGFILNSLKTNQSSVL